MGSVSDSFSSLPGAPAGADSQAEGRPDFLSGEKFKEAEEALQGSLSGAPFAALRVDGKGFSRFTRQMGYAFPYDEGFMGSMDAIAVALLNSVDGAYFAYSQSDEVSLVFGPTGSQEDPHWWFGGKTSKVISLSAAVASMAFFRAEAARGVKLVSDALFDSRVISLQSTQEAEEYLRWRRFDAQKNSVTMAASSRHSHSELMGVSSRQRAELLEGSELERLPEGFYNGRLTFKAAYQDLVWDSWAQKDSPVERKRPVTVPATRDVMETVLPVVLRDRIYREQ